MRQAEIAQEEREIKRIAFEKKLREAEESKIKVIEDKILIKEESVLEI
jgi:hypothetical protein